MHGVGAADVVDGDVGQPDRSDLLGCEEFAIAVTVSSIGVSSLR